MNNDQITLFASEKWFITKLSISFVIFIFLTAIVITNLILKNGAEYGYYFWSIYAGVTLFILLQVAFALRDVPRLTLTSDGISLFGLRGRRHWSWSEVGPFAVWVYYQRCIRHVFLVAYTDANHNLLAAHGDYRKPNGETADITIPLFAFDAGSSEQSAQQLADEINRWRDRYGAPEVTVVHDATRQQYDDLTRRLSIKQLSGAAALFVLILAAMILMLIFVPDGLLDRMLN